MKEDEAQQGRPGGKMTNCEKLATFCFGIGSACRGFVSWVVRELLINSEQGSAGERRGAGAVRLFPRAVSRLGAVFPITRKISRPGGNPKTAAVSMFSLLFPVVPVVTRVGVLRAYRSSEFHSLSLVFLPPARITGTTGNDTFTPRRLSVFRFPLKGNRGNEFPFPVVMAGG